MSCMEVSHVTQHVMCTITHDIGWLRLVGSLKLQVSFAEYSLFYGALLQKRRHTVTHNTISRLDETAYK